jgi:potassium voltage-gated channel Eag-related subfamily H protein 5
MIINFNTAFYKEGKINSNRKSIIINYIRGDFLIDFIVIIPFFIRQYGIPYIEFVLLLRVTRIKSLFDNVEEVLNLREKFAAVVDLIN